jgi:glucosyl-3-phosphoglycerate phosphatase
MTAEQANDWHARFQQLGLHEMQRLAAARPMHIAAKRFWFLRHGETEGNATRIIQHAEISLNATGFAQAERAAEALKAEPIARLFGSTMTRAWQTAETVGRAIGKAPVPEAGLRERWFGDLVGTTSVGLNWSYDPPNGERIADFVERTCATAERLLASDEATLLVAHGGNLYALAMSLKVELQVAYVANATPLRFDYNDADSVWRITPLATQGKILLPS